MDHAPGNSSKQDIIRYVLMIYCIFNNPSSRELIRLAGVCKAPVIQHFSETMSGSTTIRSFDQNDRFEDICLKLLENYSSPKLHAADFFCNGVIHINAAVERQRLQRQQQDSKSASKTPLFQVLDFFCNGVIHINAAVERQRLQRQQQDSKSARLRGLCKDMVTGLNTMKHSLTLCMLDTMNSRFLLLSVCVGQSVYHLHLHVFEGRQQKFYANHPHLQEQAPSSHSMATSKHPFCITVLPRSI
ncbi:ATP-binding cassette subfamily C member 8 [Artemisia annua]|uniref:ATP-binding cassette subfamily C member 8 n=1 Tax=Artemisia annua TaxID=35608 RepID=A0A2U1LWW5_ARTAN|nr:ATP-binding cassette subfamily C member 8 [Artemisia annua]